MHATFIEKLMLVPRPTGTRASSVTTIIHHTLVIHTLTSNDVPVGGFTTLSNHTVPLVQNT